MEFLNRAMHPYHARRAEPEERRPVAFAMLLLGLVMALVAPAATVLALTSDTITTDDTYVAVYERANGKTIPITSLTCTRLARDLMVLKRTVEGSKNDWPLANLGEPRPVRDDIATVAALSGGDTRRHLLTCDTRARWLGGATAKARFSIDITGGTANADNARLVARR